MKKVNCSTCNREILDGVRFCPYCGSEKNIRTYSSSFSKSPFEILQVTPNAEDHVIRAAYKSLAKKYHPDKLENCTSEERMKELNWAYGELSDPVKRRKWSQDEKTSSKEPTHPTQEVTSKPRKNHPEPSGYSSSKSKTSSHTTSVKNQEIKPSKLILIIAMIIFGLILFAGMKFALGNNSSIDMENNNKWELVFDEEFNSNENDWNLGLRERDSTKFQTHIQNGKLNYKLKSISNNPSSDIRAPANVTYRNFKLSVDAKVVDGISSYPAYGLFFRYTGTSRYYSFVIFDNYYGAFLTNGANFRPLIDWKMDSVINPNNMNKITVIANNSDLSFEVNGKTLATIKDSELYRGSLGVYVQSSGTEDVLIEFDNFRIWIPDDSN